MTKPRWIRTATLLSIIFIGAPAQSSLAAEAEDASWFSAISRLYGLIRPAVAAEKLPKPQSSFTGIQLKSTHNRESLPGLVAMNAPTRLPLRSSFDLRSSGATGTETEASSMQEKGSSHTRFSGSAGLGDYYAVSAIDAGKGSSLSQPDLQVNLDAGTRRNAFNTGLAYSYRAAGYQAGGRGSNEFGPYFIFSPGKKSEAASLGSSPAGAQAVFFYAGYDLTSRLNLLGSVGFAKVKGEANELSSGSASRRWGLDLAARYKLLDNLIYETHLGYVSIDGPSSVPSPLAPIDAGEQGVYQLNNQIRMTF